MKKYFILYKPFLLFLGKFLFTSLLLTFLYQIYLSQFDVKKYENDRLTELVAVQTKNLMVLFDCNTSVSPNKNRLGIDLYYNEKLIARIIEGCNALSVIILFVSFIIAFSGKIKSTILYLIAGCMIIHIFNVVRIALLCYLLYNYPNSEHLLHGVLFPLIIYGIVFILWIIWINKFSKYVKKPAKQ